LSSSGPGPASQASPWISALKRAGLTIEEDSSVALPADLAAELEAGEPGTLKRRSMPFQVPLELGIPGLDASAVQPRQVLGPFPGFGGEHWFELFGPAEAYAVFVGGGSLPVLALTEGRLPRFVLGHAGGSYTVEIAGGSVWILASALDPALPADRYVGFTATSGSVTFASAPAVTGRRLTIAGPLEATLEVKLASPASSPGAGQCQANVSIVPPSKFTATWSKGHPPLVKLGAGSASFAGETVKFTKFQSTIAAQPALDAVLFEYLLSPKKLDCGPLSNELLTLEGEPKISGGWALTLTQPADPEAPGEAIGPGFYLLFAQEPVTASWPSASAPVKLAQATLTLREGQLTLSSSHASASPRAQQTLELYALRADSSPPAPAPRLPLQLSFGPADFTLAYICDSAHGEALYAMCDAELRIDRPIDLDGRPLRFGEANPALIGFERREGVTSVTAIGLAAALHSPGGLHRRVLALRNALLAVTDPAMFLLRGTLGEAGAVDRGRLELVLGSEGWLPTLPDPYVSNFARHLRERFGEVATTRVVLAQSAWEDPEHPVLSFLGVLPEPGAVPVAAPESSPRALSQGEGQVRVPTQTQQGSVFSGAEGALVRPRDFESRGASDTQQEQLALQEEQLARLQGLARESIPSLGEGLRLLDVSTNKDLLGVEIGAGIREVPSFTVAPLPARPAGVPVQVAGGTAQVVGETAQVAGGSGAFVLEGMDVRTPAANLRVFTLPQVQWEPVRTLDIDQDLAHIGHFPTPLASATDGGATLFGVRSARLVAAIPDVAVDAALEEFRGGRGLGMLTTLPFGIKALLQLRPIESPTGRPPDSIARNQPDFKAQALQGGAQLALVAESGPSAGETSSTFEGAALQLLNGVALESGAPLNISVLGSPLDPTDSVQRIFNDEFGPGGVKPRVPVTRLDISGYGESTFSEWLHPSAAYAETAKAQFEVLVGRTALEVIKVASILYPWGIRLTRTVTIERTAGAGVIRRDSGWQASSPGVFNFPPGESKAAPYLVEPGLLEGLFNVRNIRPTGGLPVEFTSKESAKKAILTPKYFDADARIDGLEGSEALPALGLLGFLQVEPVGERLGEGDLAALIEQQGAIGGPVDGHVQVGKSGFRLRATRIEVGSATDPGSGRPELVGVLRGAPRFHQDGAWSSIRRPGPGNPHGEGEAVGVDGVQGVPVVREGKLEGESATEIDVGAPGEYRFADPADLHEPETPQYEYGFMQVSPAHAFLFPRPYVDAGVTELLTRSAPYLADVYARMTAKGVFPPSANAIQLPANTLVVDHTSGSMRLREAVDVTAPRPPLILATNGSDVVQLDYDEARLTSTLEDDSWSFDLTDLKLWSDLLGIKKFSGWSSDLHAGTSRRPVIENINTLLASEFQSALGFLQALSSPPPLPPVDLSAINGASEIQLSVVISYWTEFPPPVEGAPPHPRLKLSLGVKGQLGWEHAHNVPSTGTSTMTESGGVFVWAQVEGKIPITGIWFVLLGAQLQVGAKFLIGEKSEIEGTGEEVAAPPKPSLVFALEVKAYVGVGIETGIFEGSLAVGVAIAIEAAVVKVGPLVLLQAEVNLKIIKVEISGEFKGLFFEESSHTMCEWGGTVEINVSIAFIGIHFGLEIAEISEL
jgi:hypothetical protein